MAGSSAVRRRAVAGVAVVHVHLCSGDFCSDAIGGQAWVGSIPDRAADDQVVRPVSDRVGRRDDPLLIIEDCQEGMRLVGHRYEQEEYFISGLIMAGEIFRQALELIADLGEALRKMREPAS